MSAGVDLSSSQKIFYAKLCIDGYFTETNELFYQKLSSLKKNILPVKATSIINTWDHPVFTNAISDCVKNKHQKTGVLLRMINEDGSNYLVDWEFSSCYNTKGDLCGIACTGFEAGANLYKGLSVEMQLRVLKLMSDSASESILLLDRDFRILSYNQSANMLSLQLYNKQYTAGDDFRDYVKPEAQAYFYRQFKKAIEGNVSEEVFELPGRNGKKIFLKVEMTPVHGDRKGVVTGVAIITRDVTIMNELNYRLNEVTAMQSHQIRRPVANMISLVNLMEDDNLTCEQKEYLQLLKISIAQLEDEIQGIVKKARDNA